MARLAQLAQLKYVSIALIALSSHLVAQEAQEEAGEELQFKARGIIQAVEKQATPEPVENYDDGPTGGDAMQEEAPPEKAPIEVSFDVQMINFDYDSAQLTTTARRQVDEFGIALTSEELEGVLLTITGHTDDKGPESYNQALSERRAQAVADYLMEAFDVSADRLTVAGEGESMPLIADTTPEARAQNRRVEMTFVLP